MAKVIPKPNCVRFIIVDDNGKTLDDAQGCGYNSKERAQEAMWYRFGDGKQKISDAKKNMKNEASNLETNHHGIAKFVTEFDETWFKEIARGEVNEIDLIDAIEERFQVRLTNYQLECLRET